MALPRIDAYELPTERDLPTNRVDWKPDPSRSVLLVHDLQNHFLSAYGPGSPTVAVLLDRVAALRAAADRAGVPVLWTAQRGGQSPEERGLQQDFWGSGLPADPVAEAIPAQVAPASPDQVLTKRKYSAYVRTGLAERMAELGRDQLVITGVYAHIGVLMTAADAWMRDVQAFLVADAVADFSAADHRMALEYAAGRCASVTTAERVAAAW
ncbi:isochorismatase family protein [Streptomyces sp. NPDC097619]|uniref:isochorismatase family protein n=1 Tax=Streptomyces sp. NPDC097619 TaxID=3157228 RepID=UPI00331B0A24